MRYRDLRTSGNCCHPSPLFLRPRDQKKRRPWGRECQNTYSVKPFSAQSGLCFPGRATIVATIHSKRDWVPKLTRLRLYSLDFYSNNKMFSTRGLWLIAQCRSKFDILKNNSVLPQEAKLERPVCFNRVFIVHC